VVEVGVEEALEVLNKKSPPHPYLDRGEVEDHISLIRNGTDAQKMKSLRRLIAGAIAEWADVGADDDPWEILDAELIDFANRYTEL
jgi:hypothetical protein